MNPSSAARVALVPALGAVLLISGRGGAMPPGPATFCETYPEAPACAGGPVGCATCHTAPPSLNVYGAEIAGALLVGQPRPLAADDFEAGLGEALRAVEALDADADGVENGTEIRAGSSPADAASRPAPADCQDDEDDGWELCGYDVTYAARKVMIDVCGRSPTLYERELFAHVEDPVAVLHDTLDNCLRSEAWQGIGGRVWNLANKKIGPLQAIKSGNQVGAIPLADYDDDYAYFVWTQTGDRDARLVLTGKNFVTARREGRTTVYEPWDRTPDEDYDLRGYDRYQAVEREHRAGLLTHRWFLMSNTMFTAIPRTTAAQAYRSFLGYDLARLEGVYPVANEPADFDTRGVAADGCAACHSTLDPLAYPFSRYEGIGGSNQSYYQYAYSPDRMTGFTWSNGARVAETPERGVLFGQPVNNLVEWAEVAANSEAFRRATVLDYWKLLLGEPPRATEQAEFAALVEAFGTTHQYRVEALLHDLIDTEAYGAP